MDLLLTNPLAFVYASIYFVPVLLAVVVIYIGILWYLYKKGRVSVRLTAWIINSTSVVLLILSLVLLTALGCSFSDYCYPPWSLMK